MLDQIGRNAKEAAKFLNRISTEEKNNALKHMADALRLNEKKILEENAKDVEAARTNGMSEALVDRLVLHSERLDGIRAALYDLIALNDPISEVIESVHRPNGLTINKVRVPLGVIGMIYESRPNVTVDASGICLKSSNAVILKGGKEAIHSNIALVEALQNGLENAAFPKYCVQLIESTDRAVTKEFMRMKDYVDLLIPRGGAGLIRSVVDNATVPVIETGIGNCHLFVDAECDQEMALNIAKNGKMQRPGVCNALETILVHEKIAKDFLPKLERVLEGTELRACEQSLRYLDKAISVTEEDYKTEFVDLIAAVRVVSGVNEAIEHINRYNSKHSEVIVSNNYFHIKRFQLEVDASAVYANASSRFTDGGEFGFGAEIGISTQKFHARGPMGLRELTSYKYIIDGMGQIR